jgi:hypothetical protein
MNKLRSARTEIEVVNENVAWQELFAWGHFICDRVPDYYELKLTVDSEGRSVTRCWTVEEFKRENRP